MKQYFGVVFQITFWLSYLWGFIIWIQNLSWILEAHNAFSLVIELVLAPASIFIKAIIPFFYIAFWTFPIALVLYGIYWIINKIVTSSN